MSNSGFLWTDAGLAAASVASPSGPFIKFASFRLASGVNYSPTRGQTSLTGTTLYTGIPNTYTVVEPDTIDVVLPVPINIGDFGFGEIGLYDDTNVLLAVCVFSQLQEKIRAVGTQAGNRYRIHARLKLAQAPAICVVEVANPIALLEVPQWTNLFPPQDQLNDANAAIVHEENASGDSIMVIREADLEWSIIGFHKVLECQSTDGGVTVSSSQLIHPDLAQIFFDLPQTNSQYVVKFATGDIRRISSQSALDRVTWTPALAYVPTGKITVWKDDSLIVSDGIRIAGIDEYNSLITDFNRYWSTPSGTYSATNAGIDQTAMPSLIVHPGLTEWTALATNLRKLMRLQNYSLAQINAILDDKWIYNTGASYGIYLKINQFQTLYNTIKSSLDGSRNNVSLAYLESAVVAALARARTLPWVTNVVYDFTVSQPSENRRLGIANGGGALTITGTAGTETPFFTGWRTLFLAVGSIVVDRGTTYSSNGAGTGSAYGMANLDGVLRTLYTHSYLIAPLATTATWTLQGQTSGSGVMTFKLTFALSGSPYSSPDPGTMSIAMSARRPAVSNITVSPFAYYTGAQLGSSTF